MCASALGLTLLLPATPVFAFEPMPPIMQKLLEVFPEENGRFVDEPFGSIESMPKEARPLFETFRVVVPAPDDIDKNLARLFSASSHFPIKKITHYDKEPGAPGLPGFRGVWCQTEDKDQVGFSIVTINQNRYLIWAKMGYYPAFANDSINPKVRDQYARDVSQYLAGIDFKVPENEAPQAGGRGLPEWMGFFPSEQAYFDMDELAKHCVFGSQEILAWGLHGVKSFVPTADMLDRISDSVQFRLWSVSGGSYLQRYLENSPHRATLDSLTYDTLHDQTIYVFAMDRFGRLRVSQQGFIPPLFPSVPLLTSGVFRYRRNNETPWPQIECSLSLCNDILTYETIKTPEGHCVGRSDSYLESIGFFIAALQKINALYRDPERHLGFTISKYPL